MPKVAMRVHRSRRRFVNHPVVVREMNRVHDDVVKPYFIKQFKAITANWSNRVDFKGMKILGSDSFRVYVYPVGSQKAKQIWQWNVEGTRPHIIRAKNFPMLRFQAGDYLPKTGAGGSFYGGPGTVVGGRIRYTPSVRHPGTAARNWPDVIMNKSSNKSFYSRTVENAWKRALRRM